MRTPRIFLAYAPRAGLRCAVAYLVSPRDVYGWFTGAFEGAARTGYFLLEDYYTPRPPRLVILDEGDLYAGAIDEPRCHELARLGDFMEHEWLFRAADPEAAGEVAAFAQAELAVGDQCVRFGRLNRLSKLHIPWTYYSREFEEGVLDLLAAAWLIDYRPDAMRPGGRAAAVFRSG